MIREFDYSMYCINIIIMSEINHPSELHIHPPETTPAIAPTTSSMTNTNKKYLYRINTLKDVNDDIRDKRLLKDFHLYPENGTDTPVYAIPYNWVGHDISNLVTETPNGRNDIRNYPDWFMTTPAYNIKYSGYSNTELFKRLFSFDHQNNIKNRIGRWYHESRTVAYSDIFGKIASVVSILILLTTAAIALTQIVMRTTTIYLADNKTVNKPYTQLNTIWTWIKFVLSGCSSAIFIYNLYKRTTVPRVGVQIKSFKTPKTFYHENVADVIENRPEHAKSYLQAPPTAEGELQYTFD